jgi:hypothetical protein
MSKEPMGGEGLLGISVDAVTELTNKLIEKDEAIKRMQAALNLICLLVEKKEGHLGRPRSSGVHSGCIPCITYLATHYGAYGDYWNGEDFNRIAEELKVKGA